MATNRADRILGEWSAVARTATPPAAPAPASGARQGGLAVSLVGAVALALMLVFAFAWLGGRDEGPSVGGPEGSSRTPGSPGPTPIPTDSPAPAIAASPTPEPTLEPTSGPSLLATCDPSELAPRVTQWEGAAGSRIAHVQMTNPGGRSCETPDVWQPLLIDGSGTALIEGSVPTSGSFVAIPADASVTTLVLTNNYCGPEPVPPASIAFLVDGAEVNATTDPEVEILLPPCNGPAEPATIEMTSWGF